MRSEELIRIELEQAKGRLESYERDLTGYDGDKGAERYLFLTSINGIIRGINKTIDELEKELKTYLPTGPNPAGR